MRFYIETHYYNKVTGELEKEGQSYELWLKTYPQDLAPLHNLADLHATLGEYEKALRAGLQAIPRQQDNEDIYNEVASDYMDLGKFSEAEAIYDQAAKRGLESVEILQGRYLLAFLKSDEPEMERLVASAKGKPIAEDSMLFCAATTAAYFGKWKEARKLFQESVASAKRNRSISRAAIHQADAAVMEARIGYPPAPEDAERALKLDRNFYTEGISAVTLALAGRNARAKDLAADLNRNSTKNTVVQRIWLPTIRAALALNQGNGEDAIKELQATGSYDLSMGSESRADPIYVRGEAYLQLHNGAAAAAEFQRIIDHPGVVGFCPVAALARIGLARSYAMQGDTAKARAAYQDFLALW